MLKELNRKERVDKLDSLSKSEEVRKFLMFQDYYDGIHFVKNNLVTTDYERAYRYNVETRSGQLVYDDYKDEKVVVKANWCKPIVEVIGDYTRGVDEDIVVESEDEKAKEALDYVWKQNKINILTQELAYGSGINGKTYLRLRKRDKESDIELFQVDPSMVHEVINPITGDRESVIYYYQIERSEAMRMFPELPISGSNGWVFYAEEWNDATVFKYLDGIQIESGKTLNPYKFIPFFELPANIYKASDIADIISLNDELNITLTYINEIVRYQGFPMLAPKGTFNDGYTPLSKEQMRELEISPQVFMPIPTERVSAGGVDQSVLDYINQIEKDISIVSGVPIKLLTAELDGNMSGVSIQRVMSNVLKQAEIRRTMIDSVYKEVNNKILSLLGLPETETWIVFPEIVKIDLNEKLDEAIKKQTLGISKETIMSELGYDYEEEEKKRQEEFDNSLEKRLLDEQQAIQQNNPQKPQGGIKNKVNNIK